MLRDRFRSRRHLTTSSNKLMPHFSRSLQEVGHFCFPGSDCEMRKLPCPCDFPGNHVHYFLARLLWGIYLKCGRIASAGRIICWKIFWTTPYSETVCTRCSLPFKMKGKQPWTSNVLVEDHLRPAARNGVERSTPASSWGIISKSDGEFYLWCGFKGFWSRIAGAGTCGVRTVAHRTIYAARH